MKSTWRKWFLILILIFNSKFTLPKTFYLLSSFGQTTFSNRRDVFLIKVTITKINKKCRLWKLRTYQLFRIHVVQDPFGIILWVVPGFHDSEQELGGVVFQFKDEVHTRLTERVYVVQNQRCYNIKTVAFVCRYTVLVFVAWTWIDEDIVENKNILEKCVVSII